MAARKERITIKKGKFERSRSGPRTEKEEVQELEQAFQQVTEAANSPRKSAASSVSDDTIIMPAGGFSSEIPSGPPDLPSDPPPSEPSPVIRRNRKIALISICSVVGVLILSLIIGFGVYLFKTADNGLILDNVYVAGINLGGKTPEEARLLLQKQALTYSEQDLLVQFPDGTLTLSPVDTDADLHVDELVQKAFDYGRGGSRMDYVKAASEAKLGKHTIELLPSMTLNTDFIQQAIEQFHTDHATALSQPQVSLEGERPTGQPDLSDHDADPLAQVFQTLTITVGTPKQEFDTKALYNQVLDAYNHNDFEPIQQAYDVTAPEDVDLQALIEEHCTEPVDAVLNEKDYTVTPEVYGYGFDQKKAADLLADADYGSTITLELTYLAPEVTKESLHNDVFQDVLAEYDSIYYLNPPRTNNLELACAAIDGYIIRPGESFSFNDVVGERTAEKGYQAAGAYVDGETVDQLGGGICQVASTLYYTALYADLEILERYEHMYSVDYVPLGMDATINWGTLDFRFRNNTDHPIKIEANAKDGYVTIRLHGTDDKDYYVKMEYEVLEELKWEEIIKELPPDNEDGYKDGDYIQKYPFDGYIVDTYKCKYDKETDELISREYESHSEYDKKDQIICHIVEPKPDPTEESTAAPTEKP